MSGEAQHEVRCPACRRRYRWRDTLSGRAVRCRCGEVFNFPAAAGEPRLHTPPRSSPQKHDPFSIDFPGAAAPAIPIPPELTIAEGDSAAAGHARLDLSLDLPAAPEAAATPEKCPACNLAWKRAARVCLNCGYNLDTGGKITTRTAGAPPPEQAAAGIAPPGVDGDVVGAAHGPIAPPPDSRYAAGRRSAIQDALRRREDDRRASRIVELYLPLAFIIIGIALTVWEGFLYFNAGLADTAWAATLTLLGVRIIISVPLLLGSAILTARLVDASFGPLVPALFKLTSIAVGPLAMADLIMAYITAATLGTGWGLAIVIYFIFIEVPLIILFDLDFFESVLTVIALIMMRMVVQFFVLPAIFSML